MPPQAREKYLLTEVMTASPQRLHLMLIEGAIRFVHKARLHWAAKEDEQAGAALIRAEEIVGEILGGFKRDLDPALVKQVTSLYLFLYRTLVEAAFRRDDAKLAEALKILEIERDTWRQVCADLAAEQSGPAAQPQPGPSPIPPGILEAYPAEGERGQFSFEA